MNLTIPTISLLAAALTVACGGGSGGGEPATPAATGAEPATVEQQIAVGRDLYTEHCAGCHGAGGEGSAKAPRVVGLAEGALPLEPPPNAKFRKVRFETAADVGAWVAANMPPGEGGSLPEWQYWAILAFDLDANGARPAKKLDAASAKDIALHP